MAQSETMLRVRRAKVLWNIERLDLLVDFGTVYAGNRVVVRATCVEF